MSTNLKQEVREKLNADVENICQRLLPEGKKIRNEWVVGSVEGEAGKSMHVCLSGQKQGCWFDHAAGEGGDIISLVWKNKALKSFPEALHECARMAGITNVQSIMPPAIPKGFNRDWLNAMRGTPVMAHLNGRGIKEQTLHDYRVRTHQRKSPHNTDFIAYSYFTPEGLPAFMKSTGIHRTESGKKDIWISPESYLTLWGWWNVKPHHTKVCITEGEEDAMSLRQMLSLEDIPVLSLPNGTGNLGWVEHDFTALEQFDKIYLFLDTDGAGEDGAKKLAERLGRSRCYRVNLPDGYKDCNDVLVKAPQSAHTPLEWIKGANTYNPPSICADGAILDRTLEMRRRRREFSASGSFAWDVPFEPLPGECSLLHGRIGHGKSDCSYQLALNDLNFGKTVMYVSFEIPFSEVVENMCQQWCGHFPRDEDISSFYDWCGGRLYGIDNENDDITWLSLKDDIAYSVQRFGVNTCYIDSLGFLVTKRDYEGQDRLAIELKKLAAKYRPLHIWLLAHSRYGDEGEYVMPKFDDIEGSKGIARPFHNIFAFHRNVKKEETLEAGGVIAPAVHEEPDARFKCWKQRNGHRKRFTKDLWFHFESRSFRENKSDPPYALRKISETYEQTEDPF